MESNGDFSTPPTSSETEKRTDTAAAGELMTDEQTDWLMTGQELMTIKSTTVNSIILKDAIEEQLLQPRAPLLDQVVVGSIDNIQALRWRPTLELVRPLSLCLYGQQYCHDPLIRVLHSHWSKFNEAWLIILLMLALLCR